MADKKLNSVSPVTDAAYVYAETSNGDTVKISKADLASVVAGVMGVKSGIITQDTPTKMKLGSGFLFMNIGGSHSALFHLDYWTPNVTLIGGKALDSLGTIVQDANDKFTFTITINGTNARYFFVGFKFT